MALCKGPAALCKQWHDSDGESTQSRSAFVPSDTATMNVFSASIFSNFALYCLGSLWSAGQASTSLTRALAFLGRLLPLLFFLPTDCKLSRG